MSDEGVAVAGIDQQHVEANYRQPRGRSVFVPIGLLALAFVGWTGFQTLQLWRESDALAASRANQERPLENSRKLREGLDKIAKETQLLANRGNASARLVVDELRKRGITINPDAAAAPAPEKK